MDKDKDGLRTTRNAATNVMHLMKVFILPTDGAFTAASRLLITAPILDEFLEPRF